MSKKTLLMRELKKVLVISSVFFVIFVVFLLLKKMILEDYSIDFYVLSTALVGSLIIGKVVLIFDLVPVTKKTDHLPNIYRVFFRSCIYIMGYVIFTILEHLVKGLFMNERFFAALDSAIHQLSTPAFITSFVAVFLAFLLFNTFWVIRANVGPAALNNMFFGRNS
jgi:hypothetical protein